MTYIGDQLDRVPLLKSALRPVYRALFPPKSGQKASAISERLVRACIADASPTVLEIGCNDGRHTNWFLGMFPEAKIYCFEPEPRAIERFKSKVGSARQVQLFECALSDRNGEVTFHRSGGQKDSDSKELMPDGWDYSGSIRAPKNHLEEYDWVTFGETITVPTCRLDDWSSEQQVDHIDFIWMDVQGAEMDVFRGAQSILSKTRFIYTEYSDEELYEGQATLAQILEFLSDFEVVVQYPGDVLLRNRRFPFSPDKDLQYAIKHRLC